MKLAKTLIVSGLLFSSVLGSVNVGSITAMAAEIPTHVEGSSENDLIIKAIYFDEKGQEIKNNVNLKKEFTLSGSLQASNIDEKSFDKISGFKFVKYDSTAKTVTFRKISNIPVVFKNGSEELRGDNIATIIEDKNWDNKLSKDEIGTHVPSGYELLNPTTEVLVSNGKADIPVKSIKETSKKVTVIFVNESGQVIKGLVNVSVEPGKNGKISLQDIHAPKGYTVIPGQNPIITDNKVNVKVKANRTVSRPSAPRHIIQRVRITFVDQNSKDLVGYKQVTGKASFSTKIEAPKGYSFTNEKDATIKFDKKGNKDIKIFVKKMTSAPVKHEGVVTTTNGSYKRLYTLEGKMITNRALGVNSKWYTDQYATINGEKMYRVATNEWVKASDVF